MCRMDVGAQSAFERIVKGQTEVGPTKRNIHSMYLEREGASRVTDEPVT